MRILHGHFEGSATELRFFVDGTSTSLPSSKRIEDEVRIKLIDMYYWNEWKFACANGHLDVLRFLYSLKTKRNRIGVVEYGHFMLAAVNGHLDIILRLYLWCTNEQRSRIFFINDDSNYLFEYACRDGNLDIVQLMYSWMDFGDQRTNCTSHLYAGFREAAEYGHLEILRQIYDWCDETDGEKMIRSSSRDDLYPYPPLPAYECFTDASRKGHLDIVRQIHAWCSEAERILMVKEGFSKWFPPLV